MVMRTPEEVSCALSARREKGQFNTLGESRRVAGVRFETLYFLLTFAKILSPSQSLNLKALTRTLDETEVSSFQGTVGGETLDILHGIEGHAWKNFSF
jgi:hypothetical protein